MLFTFLCEAALGFDMICSGRDKIETPEQVSPSVSKLLVHMHTKYLSWYIEELLNIGQIMTMVISTYT